VIVKVKVSVKVLAFKKLIKINKSLNRNKNKGLENRIQVIVIEVLIRQAVEINHTNIKK
jgi:hypothetical protein